MFLLTHRLAHGSCSSSEQARCRRVHSTPIARAKLKQLQLFEHGGIYGIDYALQNQSCPLERGGIKYLRNDVRDIIAGDAV